MTHPPHRSHGPLAQSATSSHVIPMSTHTIVSQGYVPTYVLVGYVPPFIPPYVPPYGYESQSAY